ncbi:hypothetical protein RHMOL_Rhmol08G0091400 [Rhododendron molle]|uniref:Uncharacterized protein n=1 Tax=Rhododendron molle TaxID=49168 RepID=A0ACC0MLP1_RHOML|nr:hypothetical protein RHMOL_Rhmol08G0091400 [Rhododendron molle]
MKSSTPSRRCSLSRRRSGTLSSRDFGNGNSRSQLWQDCRCSGLCSSPLLPHCVTLSRTTPSTPASYQNYFTASVVDGERKSSYCGSDKYRRLKSYTSALGKFILGVGFDWQIVGVSSNL